MASSRLAVGAAIVGVLLACGAEDSLPSIDPPNLDADLVYQSDRVRIFTPPDLPFCRGDGVRMEAHLERLANQLGVEPPSPIPIYVVADDQGEAIADWCFGSFKSLGGCFQPWVIMSKAWAVPHELNHVALETLNDNHDVRGASLFWFEGYASAWETHETRPSMSGLPEQENWAAYRSADHLIRWLADIRGNDAVRDFYAMLEQDWQPADVEAAFAEAFGISYARALERFEAEAPPIYPGYGWCAGVEVIDVRPGNNRVTLRADCGAADTHALANSPVEGMYVRRILRLAMPLELQIEGPPEVSVLTRHPCLETPVESEDDPRLAEHAWYQAGDAAETSVDPATGTTSVPKGDNLFEFMVPRGEPVELELLIRATPTGK